jgi:hypothetical protein
MRRQWFRVAAILLGVALVGLVGWVGAVAVEAVRENTRTLSRLGDLAMGNERMLNAVHKDMELAAERFKVVDQQLTIIELQLNALRSTQGK